MNKSKYLIPFIVASIIFSCKYSFQSGLQGNLKTFYLGNFNNYLINVASPDIEELVKKRLKNNITEFGLKEVETATEADIQFEVEIIEYKITESLDKLFIKVKVNYVNSTDNKLSFDRNFSKDIVLKETTDITEENANELVEKLVDSILANTIYQW
jgi:hypothetical protein